MSLINLFQFFNNLKIRPYIYVEPCPKCGSMCTGRYIKEPLTNADKEYIEEKSLANGEIIRFATQVPIKNVFCVECDYKWTYNTKTSFISKEELEEEINKRGTYEAYVDFKEEKEAKDILKGNSKRGLF